MLTCRTQTWIYLQFTEYFNMIRVHANEISEMFSVTFGDLNVRRMSDSSPVIFHLSMEAY